MHALATAEGDKRKTLDKLDKVVLAAPCPYVSTVGETIDERREYAKTEINMFKDSTSPNYWFGDTLVEGQVDSFVESACPNSKFCYAFAYTSEWPKLGEMGTQAYAELLINGAE